MIKRFEERAGVKPGLPLSREKSDRYKIATHATLDAVYDWDVENDNLEWDENVTTIFGYSLGEIERSVEWWKEQVHPDERGRVTTSLNVFLEGSGQIWEEEYRFRRKDGSYAFTFDRAFVIRKRDNKAVRLVGAMQDITARKQAEQILEKSEQRFRALVENSCDCAVLFDEKGRIIYTAPTKLRLLGYHPDEATGRNISEFIYEQDRDKFKAHLLECIQNPDQTFRSLVRAVHRNGSVRIIESDLQNSLSNPAVEAIVCNYRDVTEREHFQEERGRLASIVENTSDFIGISSEDHHVLYLNPAARKMIGIEENENIHEFTIGDFHPDWAYREICGEGLRTAERDGIWSGETALVNRGGREIAISQVILAQKGTDGKVQFFSTIARDISARKQIEADIRSLNENLERRVQARTAELEAFSYSVSHDLKGPLRAVAGFSEALEQDYGGKLDAQARDYLARIRESIERMSELIGDLLELSQVDRAKLHVEAFDLSQLVADVAKHFQREHPRQLLITPEQRVKGDRQLLRIAMENLLSNAWKFTSKAPEGRVEFGLKDFDGKRAYFVRDNGAGFDMKNVAKLFIPFQRLHGTDEFEGTGVGLATVQRIIRRHGGEIWAEGAPGQGATFYFTLLSEQA